MAWSDAARAAALEVRRAHAAAKRNKTGYEMFIRQSDLGRQVMASPDYRKTFKKRRR